MSQSTNIVIRIGEPRDAAELSRLAAKLFNQTYHGKMPSRDLESYVATDFGYDQQLAELQDVNVTTLLAENEGRLVGFAQIRRNPIPVAIEPGIETELWRIYLHKSFHGLGAGKQLLMGVRDVVRSMSSHQIWLGVWEQNHRAISFYEKHGFTIVGSQAFSIGAETQNDLVMLGSANAF